MNKPRKGRRSSASKSSSALKSPIYRRILYFLVMVMTGGGAGVGGWLCKDYPQLQPILALVFGASEEGAEGVDLPDVKAALKRAVVGAVASSSGPGVYSVRLDRVQLDPRAFTTGRTVDVQARVIKIDADEAETVVWESRRYGENLAVVGRDELSANWSNRPFDVEWRRGDRFMVEVYDGRAGLFSSSRTFRMARRDTDGFPLASGEFALEPEGRIRPGTDPSKNRVVLASSRAGDSATRAEDESPRNTTPRAPARRGPDIPASLAERPILIR